MKILLITTLLVFGLWLPATAQNSNITPTHSGYAGFMVYETLNSKGEKVIIKSPIRYNNGNLQDNDQSYEYRNYRLELERVKKEKALEEKANSEEKRINSAKYYPIYFDE